MGMMVKSSSGRTVWVVDQGRLSESGIDIAFRLTAIDTKILADLLLRNKAEIDKAAEQEQLHGVAVSETYVARDLT